MQLPSSAKISISVVWLPEIRRFHHELTVKVRVFFCIKFNLPMALDVIFCKDLKVNAENSPVRTVTLFPKTNVTFYGQLVLGNRNHHLFWKELLFWFSAHVFRERLSICVFASESYLLVLRVGYKI